MKVLVNMGSRLLFIFNKVSSSLAKGGQGGRKLRPVDDSTTKAMLKGWFIKDE